jgi:hypothetical protein
MPQKLTLRFQKLGRYDTASFICSKKIPDERPQYDTLRMWHKKLNEMAPDTFLPVYHHEAHGYCTVRFKTYGFQRQIKALNKNDQCQVVFGLAKKTTPKGTFFNTVLKSLKMVRASSGQQGDELDIDSFFGTQEAKTYRSEVQSPTPPERPSSTPPPSPQKPPPTPSLGPQLDKATVEARLNALAELSLQD